MKTQVSMTALSDEELVMDLQAGNKNAFSNLYLKYFPLVYARCYSFFPERETASDHAQDVMIRVIERLPGFQFQSKFSTWLYRLTVNHCIDEYRKNKILAKRTALTRNFLDDSSNTIQHLLLEKVRAILELPGSLDDEILSQKYLHGRSIADLALQYQVSPSAIKMRLARARRRIAKAVKSELIQIN